MSGRVAMVGILEKLLNRTWTERFLLMEAVMVLAVTRVVVGTLEFRRYQRWLGRPNRETLESLREESAETGRKVGWAVRAASSRTPWKCTCLVQAAAVQIMLRRRSIPGTLYLGVCRSSEGLTAHAWVRCGSEVLAGDAGHREYTVISAYGA